MKNVELRIALDWTANTNHTGIYVAQHNGYYEKAGIDVTIITPDADNYHITPAKKLELGDCDIAIVPTESLISLRQKTNSVNVKAIAALLQNDTSAIVTLGSSGIDRPQKLDGKTYASFNARYEDAIVRQMIKHDGGIGDIKVSNPEKLGIWNTVLSKKYDACWIFRGWEGIEAEEQNIDLNYLELKNYNIPYGYSPLMMVKVDDLENRKELYKNFIAATEQGYLFSGAYPEEAINILKPFVPVQDILKVNLLKSQEYINQYYFSEKRWGLMHELVFEEFIEWLWIHKIIDEPILAKDLFENLHE